MKYIPGATYSWIFSSNLTAVGSINQNTLTVQRTDTFDGAAWVEVTISTTCNTVSATRRFNFTVGNPVLTMAVSHLNTCNSVFQTWILNAHAAAGTNWLWSVGSLGTNSQIIASPNSSYTNAHVKAGGSVRLNYNDLCGIAKIDGITVYSSCPPAFTVSPNPGVDNITVSADNSATAKMSSGALIYKIKITDRLGTIRKLME